MSGTEAWNDDEPHIELGVDVNASLQDIKKAYRRLAAKWHPDRNQDPQAVRRMQRINQAYKKMCEWLESGEEEDSPVESTATASPSEANEPPPKAKRAWWERNWGFAKWEPDGQAMPEVVQAEVSIDLRAAASGCTHQLKGFITDLCDECRGTGRLISPKSDCETCDGEGRVRAAGGRSWQSCSDCGGDGVARKACDQCEGSGSQSKKRAYHFEVKLPAGVRDGQVVILRGQGQRCGQLVSDVVLTVRWLAHPIFNWTQDQTLQCVIPVDVFTWLAKGLVEVPTLDGHFAKVSLSDGLRQSLDGLGFPDREGRAGALDVQFQVIEPERFSKDQIDLLKKLAASVGQDAQSCPTLDQWRSRLKAWQAGAH